ESDGQLPRLAAEQHDAHVDDRSRGAAGAEGEGARGAVGLSGDTAHGEPAWLGGGHVPNDGHGDGGAVQRRALGGGCPLSARCTSRWGPTRASIPRRASTNCARWGVRRTWRATLPYGTRVRSMGGRRAIRATG